MCISPWYSTLSVLTASTVHNLYPVSKVTISWLCSLSLIWDLIRSCFHLEIFSTRYFPLYQVLFQITATFCTQSFLHFFFFCVCTAVAQWETDLRLGSKMLSYYRQKMTINCMDSWNLLSIRSGFIFERHRVLLWSDLFKYFLRLYKVGIFRSSQFGSTAFPSNIPIKFNSGYIRCKTWINCWKHYSLKL